MPAPGTGTCAPWADVGDVCAPCNAYDFDEALLGDALQVASDVLFNLTGRQWPGECDEVVRPCGYRRGDSCGCLSSSTCGCRRLSQLQLPGRPVAAVTEVKIDGVVLDTARYRVDDHRWLVYLPESDQAERRGWPCCQRLDLADTEVDTWSVTYTYGQAPPLGGLRAAAALGCQLALAYCPDAAGASTQCRLPKRVTSIVRQGISMAVLDPLTLFADGITGLSEVDLWVQSVRLGAQRRRGHVFVPGRAASSVRHVNT